MTHTKHVLHTSCPLPDDDTAGHVAALYVASAHLPLVRYSSQYSNSLCAPKDTRSTCRNCQLSPIPMAILQIPSTATHHQIPTTAPALFLLHAARGDRSVLCRSPPIHRNDQVLWIHFGSFFWLVWIHLDSFFFKVLWKTPYSH